MDAVAPNAGLVLVIRGSSTCLAFPPRLYSVTMKTVLCRHSPGSDDHAQRSQQRLDKHNLVIQPLLLGPGITDRVLRTPYSNAGLGNGRRGGTERDMMMIVMRCDAVGVRRMVYRTGLVHPHLAWLWLVEGCFCCATIMISIVSVCIPMSVFVYPSHGHVDVVMMMISICICLCPSLTRQTG